MTETVGVGNVAADLVPLLVELGTLNTLPGNPRIGDIQAVKRSYEQFGQRKPIVARRADRTVIAGNHQLQAARELGWSHIAVVWTDDDDATAKAFAAADNRTADLGSYDDDLLAALLAEVQASGDEQLLAATGYQGEALDRLLQRVSFMAGQGDPDNVPEPPLIAQSRRGDLWLLGPHRLLCGDSTDNADVVKLMAGQRAGLMVTDPPYLVDYDGGNHPASPSNNAKTRDKKSNDYQEHDQDSGLFTRFIEVALAEALTERPSIYQWHAAVRTTLVHEAWKANGLLFHQQIIWVKTRPVLTRNHFMWKHEPCMYGWVEGRLPPMRPPANTTTVWEINQAGDSDGIHPTQKPVELIRRSIEWHTKPGDLIFEPFGGSGTALIAAHVMERRANVMELSPVFVDVICRRYQQHTGQVPVLEATGQPHDFTEASGG